MSKDLIDKSIIKKIPNLYETENLDSKDINVAVKLFNPVGSQTWYITEYNSDEKLGFGFCNLGDDEMAELGYVSIKELESINLPFGLKIERDLYWDGNTKLSKVISFQVR
jgi:hypothetical protein